MDNNTYPGNGPDGTPTTPQRTSPAGGRRVRRGRAIAGITLAGVLAGGAAFGAVTVLGGGTALAGPTGQAAVLNSALSSAAAPAATASGTTTAVGAKAGRHRRFPLARLRLLGGIDGQFTFETKTGPRTLAFERGTIASVADGDVVVRAADGTTWSWKLASNSVVRENRAKTMASALSAGEQVFVGGPVISGTHDARLIVIGPKKQSGGSGASGSSSSSPSPSSSSTGTGTSTS